MSLHSLLPWLAALSTMAALNAAAQSALAGASAPAGQARPDASVPYRSAFDKYQSFTDEKILPWKQSNDTVGQIGGWRAYAREAHGEGTKEEQPTPPASGSPAPAAGRKGQP